MGKQDLNLIQPQPVFQCGSESVKYLPNVPKKIPRAPMRRLVQSTKENTQSTKEKTHPKQQRKYKLKKY
jgi:hypothetical protein